MCGALIEFYPGAGRSFCEKAAFTFRLLILNKKGCLQSIFQGVIVCGVTLTFFGPQPLFWHQLDLFGFFHSLCDADVLSLHVILKMFPPSLKLIFWLGEDLCPDCEAWCSMCWCWSTSCRRRRGSWRRCPCRPSPGAVGDHPAATFECSSSWSRRCTRRTKPAEETKWEVGWITYNKGYFSQGFLSYLNIMPHAPCQVALLGHQLPCQPELVIQPANRGSILLQTGLILLIASFWLCCTSNKLVIGPLIAYSYCFKSFSCKSKSLAVLPAGEVRVEWKHHWKSFLSPAEVLVEEQSLKSGNFGTLTKYFDL